MSVCRVCVLAPILLLIAAVPEFGRDRVHQIRMKRGTRSVVVKGKFGRSENRVVYAFRARAGQKCRIEIRPEGDLDTAGHVFPPGDPNGFGGPGGTFYEGELSKTGEYRIWVERRLPSKSSSFALELACNGP